MTVGELENKDQTIDVNDSNSNQSSKSNTVTTHGDDPITYNVEWGDFLDSEKRVSMYDTLTDYVAELVIKIQD